jgi:hypothetical protein
MLSNMTTYSTLLLGQSPMLLTYIGGIIVCALLWRRAPVSALLAMLGIGTMLLATLVSIGSSMWMMRNRSGTPAASIGTVMTVVALFSTVLRAGGLALMIAAVFTGRTAAEVSGFDIQPSARRHYPPG